MSFIRWAMCVAVLVSVFSVFSVSSASSAAQPPTPPGQEEFVPLSEIPAEEQIPAFTLVATAYAAVWIVLLGYVWSVSRRLQVVERELTTISGKRT
jgi:CcmD family protein